MSGRSDKISPQELVMKGKASLFEGFMVNRLIRTLAGLYATINVICKV